MNTGLRLSVAVMLSGVLSFIGTIFILLVGMFSFDAGIPPGYFSALAVIATLGGIIGWVACPKFIAKRGDSKLLGTSLMSFLIILFLTIGALGFWVSKLLLPDLYAGRQHVAFSPNR
jgi:hypothetical protein